MSYQSINPYDGKTLRTFTELTDAQLETAIQTAADCIESWKEASFSQRAVVVTKAASIMHHRVEEFATPVTLEMGKLFAEACGEVVLSADIIDYYANNAERLPATGTLQPDSGEAEIVSRPFGVLFGVQLSELPYYQLACFVAPKLMAGNVVMVKHTGCVPQCAIAFEELWRDAGAPAGTYTNLLISHEQANRIDTGVVFINHPTWTTADLPFGGIKNSGYGRELASLGIQEFVNKKLIRTTSIDDPA